MEEVIERHGAKWKKVGGKTFTHYVNGVEVNWHCHTYTQVAAPLLATGFNDSPWMANGTDENPST